MLLMNNKKQLDLLQQITKQKLLIITSTKPLNKLFAMNILPKRYSQFKDKDYWNNFFNKLKNTDQQNFQWYGNYLDFKQQLKKIFKQITHKNNQLQQKIQTKQSISIFHIGCGKSTFGEDIQLQYPQFRVINSDYSEEIVKDMIKRSLMMKTMCKYQVCDMFEPLQPKYQHAFNVVLDKGTLDAILPEDVEEEIKKIKNTFFPNVQAAFNTKLLSTYIIVSMLQPFVLRTILQYFYQRQHYEIQIQQAYIKDSKMQPFLVYIKRHPDSQNKTFNLISIKLLKANKEITLSTIQETMKRISELQQTVASQEKVKKLSPYQHLTYNISNPQNPQKMRYTIEIIDNEQQKLNQNNCAVFIVPQGKENFFFFSNIKGLKKLIQQIGTSRLIVIRLLTGNVFKSVDQVKNEINSLMPNFIQKGCQVSDVPFMTDAQELGVRKYVYEDERVYIEEVLAGQQEAFRRVILKKNLGIIQSHYKLGYQKAQDYPHAKEVQKKTKILPAKKGKFVVIDKEYLDQGYSQQIVAGLLHLIKRNDKETSKILMLGAGGYCIPKFLYENLTPKPTIINVEKEKSLCSEEVLQIFEVLQYTKQNDFTVVNQDAWTYITQNEQKEQYSAIIVDISGNQQEQVPPKDFLSPQFLEKSSHLLSQKEGGVVVYNILRKGFLQKELAAIVGLKLFDLVYVGMEWDQDKEEGKKQIQEEECLVLFLVKISEEARILVNGNNEKLAVLGEQLLATHKEASKQKGKLQKASNPKLELNVKDQQWIGQCLSQIKLIYPQNNTNLKF